MDMNSLKEMNVQALIAKFKSNKRAPLLASLGILAVLGLAFQNCSSQMSFQADDSSIGKLSASSSITINDGALYTQDSTVTVQLKTSGDIQDMYITNDPKCETGGNWEAFAGVKSWKLSKLNQKNEVYGKLRIKGGAIIPCMSAAITHDDVPPVASIVRGPGAYSRNLVEEVESKGEDATSGIDKLECRFTGDTKFKDCKTLEKPAIVASASTLVSFQLRAVDKAGNRSSIVERNWLIDRTAPLISFAERPMPGPISQNYARFRIETSDDETGSGVREILCQLDGNAVRNNCQLNEVLNDLPDGMHVFAAWSVDKAGNESVKAQAIWTVAAQPSVAFEVLGITSSPGTGSDTEVNAILGTSLTPMVQWSASAGAAKYRITILNDLGSVAICPAGETTMTSFAYVAAQCRLQDGLRYRVSITAYTEAGVIRQAPQYSFVVDTSPPVIQVDAPIVSDDQKKTAIHFTMADPSGIRSATCKKSFKGTDQTFACKDKTSYTFENLADGEHTFSISATDGAGNSGDSNTVSWKIKIVICDPFGGVEGGCKKGLKGNIYYLTGNQLNSPYKQVDQYIQYGKLANAVLYLSQLFTPTRSFTAGFNSDDKTTLVDDSGKKLVEYFALDLETIIKLGANDQPGLYQFALLSDDGSKLEIKDSSGNWKPYLDNDQDHSTKLGCDKVGITLDANSRIPMRIKYYQGPRTEIALSLLWRHRAADQSLDDTACGKAGNDVFFGPNYNDQSNKYEYGKLVDRKWKPLAVDNYVLSEESN